MKKAISLLLLLVMVFFVQTTVFSYEVSEAYMGFSVSDEWYVFSRDMKDKDVLDALDLTKDDVNEILKNSGCDYIIKSVKDDSEIYVKTEKNELSYEYYNISEMDNAYISENLEGILNDAFSMKELNYNPEEVVITDYAQMKFITVPGDTFYDGEKHGIVFGGTVVNGSAISFTLFLDKETASEEDILKLKEIASSVSFTAIKEKSDEIKEEVNEETQPDTFDFILGGFGAIVIIVFCICIIEKMRNKDEKEEEKEQ